MSILITVLAMAAGVYTVRVGGLLLSAAGMPLPLARC